MDNNSYSGADQSVRIKKKMRFWNSAAHLFVARISVREDYSTYTGARVPAKMIQASTVLASRLRTM